MALGLPDVLGMSRGFTIRHAKMIEDLGFDMQFNMQVIQKHRGL